MMSGLGGGVEEPEMFWPRTTEVRRTGGERSLEGKCNCRLGRVILEMSIKTLWRCQEAAGDRSLELRTQERNLEPSAVRWDLKLQDWVKSQK